MAELLTKMEKKIRIRVAKRVLRRVQNRIPTSKWGTTILTWILFIEKVLRKDSI